ncbi:MAG: hypothetical protein QW757_03785 [Candidatus Woesearchaeota archaeon]
MRCIKCNNKATIFLKTYQACEKCFIKIIDKRIRKEIRDSNIYKFYKDADFYLIDDKTYNSIFNIKFFISFFKDINKKEHKIKIINLNNKTHKNKEKNTLTNYLNYLVKEAINFIDAKEKNKHKIKKNKTENKKSDKLIILPWNLEQEANLFLESVFYNKNFKKTKILHFKHKYYFFKPLIHISEEEIKIYFKIKKITPPINMKNNNKKLILDNLSKEYPEINFAILKSIHELKKQLQK